MFHHRGVSLVELLVVMSAASIILSLSAGLIHRAMHAETKARALTAVERAAIRLSHAFRHDVNRASDAVMNSAQLRDRAFIHLQSKNGGSVEYRRDERTIYRLQYDGERIVAREQFVFAADFDLQSHVENSRLIELTLTSAQRELSHDQTQLIQRAHQLPVYLQVVAALERGGQ